jgi:hypothetical protein
MKMKVNEINGWLIGWYSGLVMNILATFACVSFAIYFFNANYLMGEVALMGGAVANLVCIVWDVYVIRKLKTEKKQEILK